ncbi:MAG: hypothetical protein EXR28_06050 [Betaproteobacteria bacterium]|nr:hypothetical protein [Betaproteobacteria bacterium]
MVVVSHPFGGVGEDEIRRKADAAVDEIIHVATSLVAVADSKEMKGGRTLSIKAAGGLEAFEAFNELCAERGWSDGLPLMPPRRPAVETFLTWGVRAPGEVVATIQPSGHPATAELVAAVGVMAGCEPRAMPVLLAVTEALGDPRFNLAAIATTTGSNAPLVLVSGPVAADIGLNPGPVVLGPGCRANATLGRFVRLLMLTVGGLRPGVNDMSTLGTPHDFSCCLAENETESPWEPYHVEAGYGQEQSTVTVFPSKAPIDIHDHISATAEELLTTLAHDLSGQRRVYPWSQVLLLLCPEHAQDLAREGLSKDDVRRHLQALMVMPYRLFKWNLVHGDWPTAYRGLSDDTPVHLLERPELLRLVVTGGKGKHSAWTRVVQGLPVTKAIRTPASWRERLELEARPR